ncbi:uncharacterized protein PgNI_05044 [Pyricularia grisea]|uniref:Uncharacterized protein n=1 Tax=Pyricularia grisea TaxID=148305 RepID=A0A6P8BER9_PYRGI|nr:uncharacterized protein PgNI_05044 [Pyricularia grisea]TLD14338.1 hypothetical protein PgNI_05044 [Pyricularia grisea]
MTETALEIQKGQSHSREYRLQSQAAGELQEMTQKSAQKEWDLAKTPPTTQTNPLSLISYPSDSRVKSGSLDTSAIRTQPSGRASRCQLEGSFLNQTFPLSNILQYENEEIEQEFIIDYENSQLTNTSAI